jgi:hypothetical protein
VTQPTPNAKEPPDRVGGVATVRGVAASAVVGEVQASGSDSSPNHTPATSNPLPEEENRND